MSFQGVCSLRVAELAFSRILRKDWRSQVHFHASSLVYSRFFFFFALISLPVFTSKRSSSPLHEWKITNGQNAAILSEQLTVGGGRKKNTVLKQPCAFSVGTGDCVEGLWWTRSVFWGIDAVRKGGFVEPEKGSGGSTWAQPRKGAPSPACGSVFVRRQGGHLSLANLDTFDTWHIQAVFVTVVCLWNPLLYKSILALLRHVCEMCNPSALS